MVNEVTKGAAKTMRANFSRLRRDLPEGREWRVTSDSGNDYAVTVWTHPSRGRLAECTCRAGQFGQACRHIRFIQGADGFLTRAPQREIKKAA